MNTARPSTLFTIPWGNKNEYSIYKWIQDTKTEGSFQYVHDSKTVSASHFAGHLLQILSTDMHVFALFATNDTHFTCVEIKRDFTFHVCIKWRGSLRPYLLDGPQLIGFNNNDSFHQLEIIDIEHGNVAASTHPKWTFAMDSTCQLLQQAERIDVFEWRIRVDDKLYHLQANATHIQMPITSIPNLMSYTSLPLNEKECFAVLHDKKRLSIYSANYISLVSIALSVQPLGM